MSAENQLTSPTGKAPANLQTAKQKTPLMEMKANARLPSLSSSSPTDATLSPCTKLLSKPQGKRAKFSRMPKKVLMKQMSETDAQLHHIEEELKGHQEASPVPTQET